MGLSESQGEARLTEFRPELLWEVPLLTCGRSSRSAANREVREF